MNYRLTFLGSGTSTGTPVIGCRCGVCASTDPRDTRLRASALLEIADGPNILIDCGPDFRQQILRAGSPRLDALIVTHTHYDHVGGVDDLRPYCYKRSAAQGRFPVYCRADVARDFRQRVPYSFKDNPYPGAPTFRLHEIAEGMPFTVEGVEVLPLAVNHGSLPILGFRIGPLAYITDALTIPDATLEAVRGVDTLVVNALRHHAHVSHMNLRQALAFIDAVGPRRAYLTHMCHQIGYHRHAAKLLPPHVAFAYDTLVI